MGGRKQPAMLAGADFMQFSDATVSRRHFGMVFDKEVCVYVSNRSTWSWVLFPTKLSAHQGLSVVGGSGVTHM